MKAATIIIGQIYLKSNQIVQLLGIGKQPRNYGLKLHVARQEKAGMLTITNPMVFTIYLPAISFQPFPPYRQNFNKKNK